MGVLLCRAAGTRAISSAFRMEREASSNAQRAQPFLSRMNAANAAKTWKINLPPG
ncbi:hypothetical protein [Streptomyces subrutilus]|uniref:hypothetical protein n=1 Tax=Streptomyces subrutilus TaxID=36818 RepID=UPI0014319B05|nr:hypothetical protein [Streptomyces subrutilus]